MFIIWANKRRAIQHKRKISLFNKIKVHLFCQKERKKINLYFVQNKERKKLINKTTMLSRVLLTCWPWNRRLVDDGDKNRPCRSARCDKSRLRKDADQSRMSKAWPMRIGGLVMPTRVGGCKVADESRLEELPTRVVSWMDPPKWCDRWGLRFRAAFLGLWNGTDRAAWSNSARFDLDGGAKSKTISLIGGRPQRCH